MKRLLGYVAAYLLWIVAAALGVWFIFVSRSAFLGALALYAKDSIVRGWQARFFDKVYAIAVGLLWLVVMIVVEVYFRKGGQRQALLRRFVKVAGPEFLAIFAADAFLLWVQGGSESWLRWLALGGELVLGVALVWLARSIKKSRLAKTTTSEIV